MTRQKESHELLDLALVGGAAFAVYLWIKGKPEVPDAPAGSSIPVQADVQVNRVKAGWLALFPSTAPTSTDTTPVVITTPVTATTTLPPITTTTNCVSGIGMLEPPKSTTYMPGDTGTTAILSASLTSKNLPASPDEIAAAAVTAQPVKVSTCNS